MDQSEYELRRRNALGSRERRRQENANIGWHEICDEDECNGLRDRLKTLLPTKQPGVPSPSITWDVTAATGMQYRSPDQLALMNE